MKRYKKPLLIGGTMLAIFAILGAVLPTSGANILSRVLIMMLFGTAVNVMFGHSGLIAFGQGIFFGGAAYAYVLLVVRAGLNHGAAVVVTMLGVLAASFLIGKLCLRVQAFTFALLFMGLNILAYNIAMKVPALGSGSGVTGSVRPPMVSDTRAFFVMTLIVVAVCYFIIYKILHSSLGKVANGLRENEERLVFLGINVKNVKLAMIMVSSFFCGVAGVLYAMLNLGAYTAYLNVLISEEGLIMCIVGGMYCFWGPSIGAVLITIITVYIAGLTVYYKMILGIVLIVAIIFFPNGLLGQSKDGKGNPRDPMDWQPVQRRFDWPVRRCGNERNFENGRFDAYLRLSGRGQSRQFLGGRGRNPQRNRAERRGQIDVYGFDYQ